MSLKNPYKARNADFETMEELLLVKGVTGELLYGGGGKGLIDILSVNAKSGKINLNAAPREVLLAVPGMTAELADALIANRSAEPALSVQAILGGTYAAISKYADAMETRVFTVESSGYQGADKAGYGIRATIMLETNNKFRYLYYKSPVTGREAASAGEL
jgi:general secretion pathway protein K